MNGFDQASTRTLTIIAANLRAGLDVIAGHLAVGTFHTVGSKGAAPPSQSGQITLALLDGVEAELASRSETSTSSPDPGQSAINAAGRAAVEQALKSKERIDEGETP